jgi:hypothetical protein
MAHESGELLTCDNGGGPPGNRTPDHRIKSPLEAPWRIERNGYDL